MGVFSRAQTEKAQIEGKRAWDSAKGDKKMGGNSFDLYKHSYSGRWETIPKKYQKGGGVTKRTKKQSSKPRGRKAHRIMGRQKK